MNKNSRVRKLRDHSTGLFQVFTWCLTKSWMVSWPYTLIRILLEVLNPILNFLTVFVSAKIISVLSSSQLAVPANDIKYLLIAILSISLIKVILVRTQTYISIVHSDQLEQYLLRSVMDVSFKSDIAHFDDPEYQDKMVSAKRDGSLLVQALSSSISAISSTVAFVLAIALLSKESLIYAAIILISAIPSAIILKYYTESLYHLSLSQINDQRQLSYIQHIATDRKFAQDIRLFKSDTVLKDKHHEVWSKIISERKRILKRSSIQTMVWEFAPEIAMVAISGHIAFRVINGTFSVGDYIFIGGLLTQLWMSTSSFISNVMHIMENKLRLSNYNSLFLYEKIILDDGSEQLFEIQSIEFDEVYFKYPFSNTNALKGVSFSIEKPEKVAFVGLNGSGKTTIIKLLLRFYEPTSGKILINNRLLSSYSLDSLRNAFSVYFQDMENFAFSVEDNFFITNPYAPLSEEHIEDCLRQVDFSELIQSPKGIKSYLSKYFSRNGIILSGGQIQKVALARTLYRKGRVLILDEVSSNLDPEAENFVFESLKKITKENITLFTSHRLSNISLSDRIIVLENGIVIEDGSPLELTNNNTRFKELLRYQQEKMKF